MFRFLIQKKAQGKYEVTRNLSSSVIENFNSYEMMRQNLARKERVDIIPVDIVYEPTYDENIPVACFFTSKIHLAYKSYVGRFETGKERICSRVVKQCYYCENSFAKTDESRKKHMFICAAMEGITYAFDNGQIKNFKDNFRYMGDAPFTVYFDFETATGSSVFFLDTKLYVISYCQIYSFHPSLNLDKVVIFRSFQQAVEEIYHLNHFKQEHIPFFNKATFYQLKDAAFAVLA